MLELRVITYLHVLGLVILLILLKFYDYLMPKNKLKNSPKFNFFGHKFTEILYTN